MATKQAPEFGLRYHETVVDEAADYNWPSDTGIAMNERMHGIAFEISDPADVTITVQQRLYAEWIDISKAAHDLGAGTIGIASWNADARLDYFELQGGSIRLHVVVADATNTVKLAAWLAPSQPQTR